MPKASSRKSESSTRVRPRQKQSYRQRQLFYFSLFLQISYSQRWLFYSFCPFLFFLSLLFLSFFQISYSWCQFSHSFCLFSFPTSSSFPAIDAAMVTCLFATLCFSFLTPIYFLPFFSNNCYTTFFSPFLRKI